MSSYVWILTVVHTLLSFVAIGFGISAISGLFGGHHSTVWTRWFFITAAAVTLTGFIFPFTGITPAFATGLVSTVILIAWFIAHRQSRVGAWRWIYAVGIVASLYLLIFVTIAQAFLKIPFLNALAPTGAEAPFAVAQVIALIVFIVIGIRAVSRFRPTLA
jgi:hypothetical protein